ncbi:DUF3306 domain-containing protein [Aromatoleum petrolei]|uniref:DUF3306 domain-containing protein n=1 Tax=Aromatoleum petrolei TaxID=76116 RepID=A0ABX1MNX2_9RHOO|nr:DUF3306 domain-containing protein [Aromatoleum petrolei]NMF89642.1 DUF3306 domain-containing protein [Aromatoleum petrolei]QTQ36615.1 putative protein DUF3306 [Aromatoleum petrolei]
MTRFLERWSRLKRGETSAAAPAAPVVPAAPSAAGAASRAVPPAADAATPASPAEAALPPIDSLDLAADFSAFMKKEVSESLRRAALRKLFSDPHFHFERMDKLDIYIDDYSGGDPIPADMLQKLRQFETLLKDEEADESAVQPAPPQAAAAAEPGPSPAAATSAGEDEGDGHGDAMPEHRA